MPSITISVLKDYFEEGDELLTIAPRNFLRMNETRFLEEKANEELKSYFLASNIRVFGIAKMNLFGNAPSGHRPSDILSIAKNILHIGFLVPKGIFKSKERAEEGCTGGQRTSITDILM